jgi:hypothetical protein
LAAKAVPYHPIMASPLRVEYPGAIYHVMSRDNLRLPVFENERDYWRLIEG